MRHIPTSKKGLRRRWIVAAIEHIVGIALIVGSLYLFCALVNLALTLGGVNY